MRKSRFQIPVILLRMLSLTLLKIFYRFEIHGLEHLKNQKGGFILAGNHAGYLDSLLIYATLNRDFSFLMKEEVFSWKMVGQWVRYGNIIPLYEGKEKRMLVTVLQLLKAGHPLCIFPEGRLTETGELNPFQEGVAFLQEKSQVPILPFAIQGGFEAWAYGQPWPNLKRGSLRLVIGPAIPFEAQQSRQNITEHLYQKVNSLYQWQPVQDALVQSKASEMLTY
jgi:1-acyl-sn-glycerol-3-phosphate acyltransferase